jgi:hypothetical protein
VDVREKQLWVWEWPMQRIGQCKAAKPIKNRLVFKLRHKCEIPLE